MTKILTIYFPNVTKYSWIIQVNVNIHFSLEFHVNISFVKIHLWFVKKKKKQPYTNVVFDRIKEKTLLLPSASNQQTQQNSIWALSKYPFSRLLKRYNLVISFVYLYWIYSCCIYDDLWTCVTIQSPCKMKIGEEQ